MTDKPTPTDAVALARYKVVPAHESMFHRFAVVAGDGKQQLYLGREVECENMARKFAGAFLDGAFYQANITPSTQAAGSVPAIQGETNVQLDIDSNHSAPGQQRDMVGALAVGQHVGDRAHETAGNPCAERDVSLRSVAVRNLRSFLHSATFKSESDRQAALTCVDVLQEARPAPPAMGGGDAEDAARYRWIRGPVEESTRYSRWRIEYWDGPNGWQPMQRERMDSAIDAARAAQKESSHG